MPIANWAIVCGAVRDVIDFKLTLSQLLEARRAGLLEEILVSTWEGEIDAHKGLRKRLDRTGVLVLESEDVPVAGPAHYFRQLKAFAVALDFVPAGCGVFKVRTDKSLPFLDAYTASLRKGPVPTEAGGACQPVFSHKIDIHNLGITQPFSFLDMGFYGYREDLSLVGHLDAQPTLTSYNDNLNPGYHWLSVPLAHRHPLARLFYRWIDPFPVSTALVHWAREDGESALPPFLNELLAEHLMSASINLRLVSPGGPAEDLTFRGLLGGAGEVSGLRIKEMNHLTKVQAVQQRILSRAVKAPLDQTPAALAFFQAVENLRQAGPRGRPWEREELHALTAFCNHWVGAEVKPVNRPPIHQNAKGERKEYKGEDAINFLRLLPHKLDVTQPEGKTILSLLKRSFQSKSNTQTTFYKIGLRYETGDGLPQSDEKARWWFQRAADRKHPLARQKLS